jgi:hypothetical protein
MCCVLEQEQECCFGVGWRTVLLVVGVSVVALLVVRGIGS